MFKRTLVLSASLAVLASVPAGLPHEYAQAQGLQDSLALTQQAVDETRQSLAQLDANLEYPLSDAEKSQSQTRLDEAKSLLQSTGERKSAEQVLELAREARDLARSANKAAKEGDRKKAIASFTDARIRLQEVRHCLSVAEAGGQAGDQSVLLTGRARKDGELAPPPSPPPSARPAVRAQTPVVAQSQGSPAGVHLGGSAPGGNTGSINIGPGGVQLKGISGAGPAGQINIGPGPATRQAAPPARRQAAGGGISITPSGIQVGSGGGISIQGGGSEIQIGPGGIDLGGLGALGALAGGSTGQTATVSGNTIMVAGNHQNEVYDVNGHDVVVGGNHNQVTVRGNANSVTVAGNHNTVVVHASRAINATGNYNTVYWSRGVGSAQPALYNTGSRNTILQSR